jgi:hypothetical protein
MRFSRRVHPPLGRRLAPAAGLVTAVLLVGLLTAPAGAAADEPQPEVPAGAVSDGADDAATDPTEAAEQALADVQAILEPEATGSTETVPTEPQDLTLALRELRLRADDLPTARSRAAARALLSRPDAFWADKRTLPSADGKVLVHWNHGTVDDPAYPTQVAAVAQHVLGVYRNAGYRAPKSDGTRGGGSGIIDIYLDNLGDQGVYGYCDTDVTVPANGPYDAPAFCALDNDFAEFPNNTPVENLRVTAAHELFHAVQFAYDYTEDSWFMEATATWAEDELYDGINDNRQYLRQSPLKQPGQSLDQFSQQSLRQYGEWIFFRYLTERYPASQATMPVIVRQLWRRVDGAAGRPDDYSIRAVDRELKARGTDLRRFYARFADANRRPRKTYEEGAAYPTAPALAFAFRPRSHNTGWRAPRVDHLASRTLKFTPSASMRRWRLHVAVDLPNRALGSAAVLTTYDRKGRPTRGNVAISRRGNGTAVVRFGTVRVARVELTLVNAGIRYDCWRGTVRGVEYSCKGKSKDDDRAMRYRVWATR